ncbi:MAG: hypothetical protein JRH16_08650 [Deltaproteobacteria bacterium]|nr:hypothetical protein [Deltaproteobacteria bacterium]MBW2363220.1 hypothetical protein [Deltaproteobacteria bacterium]
MKPTVFIQTNLRQIVGAHVAEHSLRRNSRRPDAFDVRILNSAEYPFFQAKQGQEFLRGGTLRRWWNEDLQSFTPIRFMPPELMEYQGRAVVIDPDIFAVGDVLELLEMDMGGKALMAVPRSGFQGVEGYYSSSSMLLDCAQLTHWRCEEQFNQMFEGKLDYLDWIALKLERPETIGALAPEWNHFDILNDDTKLLHTTHRRTQPWKTGLPIDFTPGIDGRKSWVSRAGLKLQDVNRRVLGRRLFSGKYKPHPDPHQEAFFFGLLRECVDEGIVSEAFLREQMRSNHVRHDAFEVLERTPKLPAPASVE